MLRVYWAWPGVSAMMNRRRGVAKWRYATSIVMPCSRSARRPSVSSARSGAPFLRDRLQRVRVERLGVVEQAADQRRLAVVDRARGGEAEQARPPEVALPLAVLHGGLRHTVVGARLAALGDPRGGDLGDDVLQRHGARAHRAGARHVAHRAVADPLGERLLAVHPLDEVADRVEHPVALEHLALVGGVERRHLEPLGEDVLPHVELGPVGDREHADVLAAADPAVVERPQLGPLAARVPLPEVVAEGEDPLLRAGALLVPARAAERRVEPVLLDGVEQRDGLEPVARGARAGLVDRAALVDRVLDRGDDQRSGARGGRGTRSPPGSCARCPRA